MNPRSPFFARGCPFYALLERGRVGSQCDPPVVSIAWHSGAPNLPKCAFTASAVCVCRRMQGIRQPTNVREEMVCHAPYHQLLSSLWTYC
jgi:hypothetical protein